jgi:hypothetical protein
MSGLETMVERVARAMWVARQEVHGHHPDDGPWETQPDSWRDWVRHEARAAIAEMQSWLPMDTAPQDGTRILIDFKGAGPIVAFRSDHYPNGWVRYLGFGKSAFWPTINEDFALGWMAVPDAALSPSGEA